MSRATAWFVHLSALLAGGTGLVYGWMRYCLEPVDEFAVVNHPAQPLVQALHLWTVPLLVFGGGLLWREHVWRRVRTGYPRRRRSGLVLFALFFPMVLSGAVVQTADGDLVRNVAILVHAGSGTLWFLAYAAHFVLQLRRGSTGPSGESTAESNLST